MKKFVLILNIFLFSLSLFSQINLIKTTKVMNNNFSQSLDYFGQVAPLKQWDVVSYSKGVISKINYKNGDKVKKGELICRIKGYYDIKRQRLNLSDNVKSKFISIKSPAEGFIYYKKLEGNAIDENELICKITDLKTLIVKLPVFIEDIKFIKVGQLVKIKHNYKEIEGKIYTIFPQSDSETQIVAVKFHQNKPIFYPGEFVNVTIPLQNKNALSVPIKSIVKKNGKSYVIIKTENGYEKRKVQTGLRNKNFIEIKSGLQKNDIVVTEGAYEIFSKDLKKTYKVED